MAGKFEITPSKDGKFFFNLKAGNGEVILTSGMFADKAAAATAVDAARARAANDGFERKEQKDGKPFFTLNADDGSMLGKSEAYSSASAMENGIQSVMKNAADAKVVELDG